MWSISSFWFSVVTLVMAFIDVSVSSAMGLCAFITLRASYYLDPYDHAVALKWMRYYLLKLMLWLFVAMAVVVIGALVAMVYWMVLRGVENSVSGNSMLTVMVLGFSLIGGIYYAVQHWVGRLNLYTTRTLPC